MTRARLRVNTMGRDSTAAKILKDVDDIPDDREAIYLVFYDWTTAPVKQFYINLERINASRGGEVERLQNTVLSCRRPRTASALILLIQHFNMKANVFEAEEVDLDDLRRGEHEPEDQTPGPRVPQ